MEALFYHHSIGSVPVFTPAVLTMSLLCEAITTLQIVSGQIYTPGIATVDALRPKFLLG